MRLRPFFSQILFLLCVLGFLSAPSVTYADSRCASCQQKASAPCKRNCAHVTDPIKGPQCVTACQKRACARPCKPARLGPAEVERRPDLLHNFEQQQEEVSGGLGECDRCLKKQRAGYCRETCSDGGIGVDTACSTRCAKRMCARECLLPGKPVREEPRPTQKDCGTCKRTMQIRCSQRCGDKDRAGYVACEVSCIEDACLETCNPELF